MRGIPSVGWGSVEEGVELSQGVGDAVERPSWWRGRPLAGPAVDLLAHLAVGDVRSPEIDAGADAAAREDVVHAAVFEFEVLPRNLSARGCLAAPQADRIAGVQPVARQLSGCILERGAAERGVVGIAISRRAAETRIVPLQVLTLTVTTEAARRNVAVPARGGRGAFDALVFGLVGSA